MLNKSRTFLEQLKKCKYIRVFVAHDYSVRSMQLDTVCFPVERSLPAVAMFSHQ
jgi:hypothetical protein